MITIMCFWISFRTVITPHIHPEIIILQGLYYFPSNLTLHLTLSCFTQIKHSDMEIWYKHIWKKALNLYVSIFLFTKLAFSVQDKKKIGDGILVAFLTLRQKKSRHPIFKAREVYLGLQFEDFNPWLAVCKGKWPGKELGGGELLPSW